MQLDPRFQGSIRHWSKAQECDDVTRVLSLGKTGGFKKLERKITHTDNWIRLSLSLYVTLLNSEEPSDVCNWVRCIVAIS